MSHIIIEKKTSLNDHSHDDDIFIKKHVINHIQYKSLGLLGKADFIWLKRCLYDIIKCIITVSVFIIVLMQFVPVIAKLHFQQHYSSLSHDPSEIIRIC